MAREHGSSKELQERQIMRLKYVVEIQVGGCRPGKNVSLRAIGNLSRALIRDMR